MAAERILVRRAADIGRAVDEALDFLGYDFGRKRVWIKPNLLQPSSPDASITTDPEIIRRAVRGMIRRGVTDVWVFDNPGGALRGTVESFISPEVMDGCEGSFRRAPDTPHRLALKSRLVPEVPVSRHLLNCDVILNLPVFKTHALTLITGAIKNLFGLIPGGHKASLHRACPNPNDFSELLVDIYQAVPVPVLTIVDALRGMDGQTGPSAGRVLRIGRIISGPNPIAVDAVLALMAGTEPDRIPTVRIAAGRGLGPSRREDIDISGDFAPVPDFVLPSARAAGLLTRAAGRVQFRLMRHPPVLNQEKCIRCRRCAENCPADAITMFSYPVIDRDTCIACYCCAEICPEHAFHVPGIRESLWLNLTGR